MPKYSELNFDERKKLAELFLDLPYLSVPGKIENTIAQLPKELWSGVRSVPAGQTVREVAVSLLDTCGNREDGLLHLMHAVALMGGACSEYKTLGAELYRLGLITFVPEPSPIPPSERIISGLLTANRNFVGRETQLAVIQKTLAESKRVALCAVQGMGGIGKTTLALEYAHRHAGEYRLIAWLNAADATTLHTSFSTLAHALKLPEAAQADYNLVRRAVLNYLAGCGQWLLVYDNAKDPATLREYLPGGTGGGHILITSRNAHWQGLATLLEVETLPEAEALELLLKSANRTAWQDDAETEAAKTLVKELGSLPLALAQAGAFMEARQIRPAKYLEYFGKRKLELFKDAPFDYEKTVATTWNIGVEQLEKEQPKALALLNLCAFLAPEPIRFALLQEARDKLLDAELEFSEELATLLDRADEFELVEVCSALRRYALITVDETLLSLHRLVGLVTRENLIKDEIIYARYVGYAVRVIRILYHQVDPTDYRDWERCEELLQHTQSVVGYAENAKIALDFAGVLYSYTGLYLKERAAYTDARQNLERAIVLGELDLGKEHPEVATRYNNLGVLLQNMGDSLGAKLYLEHAIVIGEQTLCKHHPSIAKRYNNFAEVLQDLGNFSDAKDYYERAITIGEHIYDSSHPQLAIYYNNLGRLLYEMDDLHTAKSYYERAIAIHENAYSKEHPAIAIDYSNYGLLLYDLGDWKVARHYLTQALTIFRATFREQHPDTQNTLRLLTELEAAQRITMERNSVISKELNKEQTRDAYESL